MDSMGAVTVVVTSAVIVIFIIVLMSKSRSRRARRVPVEAERREITSRERRTWIESQRQQPRPEMAEENLIPSLDEQLDEQLNEQPEEPQPSSQVSQGAEAGVPSLYPEEELAGSKLAKTVEIPALEDEAEFAEETVKQGADAGLSAFMVEVSEDDGLSKIAESLEDLDAGNIAEMARDIQNKGAK